MVESGVEEETLPDFGRAITLKKWEPSSTSPAVEAFGVPKGAATVHVAHIDCDDWHFFYVEGKLVYQGHSGMDYSLATALFGSMDCIKYVEWAGIDSDTAIKIQQKTTTLHEALGVIDE